MRRIVLLLALPVGLGVLWLASDRAAPSTAAEIDIVTDKVTALRGSVITRLGTIGGVRIGENTDYSGGGESELTFRVPAARIEEALSELGQVGGQVTSQRIDLEDASAAAGGLTRRLADLQGCLSDIERGIGEATPAAMRTRLNACEARLDTMSSDLSTALPRVDEAVLTVRIHPSGNSNGILIIGIAMLAIALAVMATLTLRTVRAERTIDLSDEIHLPRDEDVHHHRKWN